MFRKLLRSKIHRATVTDANLEYEGSITVPPELLELAGLSEFEAVCVWNVSNGNRFETYTIRGLPASHDICVNGAAAHLVKKGDIVIIASFGFYPEEIRVPHQPRVVFVDELNRPKEIRSEIAGPQTAFQWSAHDSLS